MTDTHDFLGFWFGPRDDDAETAKRQARLWWRKDPDTEAELRERFGPSVEAVGGRRLDSWGETPPGRLALILLTDQLPRNIHRETPGMYRYDEIARRLCIDGVSNGMDTVLRPIERVFFYLPLQHSESADRQAWCVDLMRGLVGDAPSEWAATAEAFVKYAEAHRRIIDRFGRFPHRNAILGRDSSDEERAFLAEPGSSF